jgi:hypothetical protein
VSCGPEITPPSTGTAVEATTGDALLEFSYEGRGGQYDAWWTGCEAKHFFDSDGDSLCGILWDATGSSYGEQIQASGLVVRFAMQFTLKESTCGPAHPDAQDYELFFRVSLTEGDDGLVNVTWSYNSATPPANMFPWVSFAWDGEERPDEVGFEYRTEFEPSSN